MNNSHTTLLAALAAAALFTFPALALSPIHMAPAAMVHIVLMGGIFPLILGAMLHFTPVLTRSTPPRGWVNALPLLGMAAGVAAVTAINSAWPLILLAVPLAMAAAGGVLAWMVGRIRHCLGTPHPGVYWYPAALLMVLLGLGAMAWSQWQPQLWPPLRNLHLHLNLLGFVGLTAVGTLQVLLPTAAGYQDPGVAGRLHRDLPPALAGTLLLAAGSAWLPPLAWVGLLLWLVAPVRLLGAALRGWPWRRPANGLPLLGALLGLLGVMAAGALHTTLPLPPRALLNAFLLAFLFPLVSGALTHLLPLWLWPGPQAGRQEPLRAGMARHGGWRTLLWLIAGGMALGGVAWAAPLGVAVMVQFMGQALLARRRV